MPTRLIELVQAANWAIMPEKLDAIHEVLARHGDPGAWSGKQGAGSEDPSDRPHRPYQILAGGVALIPVHGVIAKRMNLFGRISGGTSSEIIARDFQAAVEDPDVRAILLDVDSPGGTVDGTEALALRVYAARAIKPVTAFANGLMASAAYWIGSAAQAIVIEETGAAGSIGVVQAHYDYSEADKQAGVKRTYIYAGKYKTAGNTAEPLNPESIEYLQSGVDYIYSLFVDTVARHRGVTIAQALAMAEGRIFIGRQALDIGLTDVIGNFEQAHAIARDMAVKHYIFGHINKEDYIMANENAPRPITLARLNEECPDLVAGIRQEAIASVDPSPFRAEGAQTEREQLLGLAETYFGKDLADKFRALAAAGTTVEMYEAMKAAMPQAPAPVTQTPKSDKMGEMLAAIQDAGPPNPGPNPLSHGPGDFVSAWQAIKAEKKCSTADAMRQAVKAYPDLHQTYLDQFQGQAGRA